MTTDLQHTDLQISDELSVEDWRYRQLVKAGWPEAQALALATNHHVDLHLACELLAKGCGPDVAWQTVT